MGEVGASHTKEGGGHFLFSSHLIPALSMEQYLDHWYLMGGFWQQQRTALVKPPGHN